MLLWLSCILALHPDSSCNADPIHDAAMRGDAKTLRELLKKTPVDARDAHQATPLLHAAGGRQPKDLEAVQVLLNAGADINAKHAAGNTALHAAAGDGHGSLIPSARPHNANKAIMRLLLAKGADVNAHGTDGETPLHKAAVSGNLDAVKLLLEAHADVNARDKYDHTPLHSVVVSSGMEASNAGEFNFLPYWGHKGIVQVLLAKGVDVNAQDKMKKTALKLAMEAEANQARHSHAKKSNAPQPTAYGSWAEIAKLLREAGAKE